MTRLIDADTCIAKIKDMPVTYDSETVQRCIEVLSNAQTIDAEPVRHGKWIFESIGRHGVMTCSECRKMQDYQTLCFTYCPNCGARMDEERKEE